MKTISGAFAINTGGQVKLANRNMTPKESGLERKLFDQVSGKPSAPVIISPNLAAGYAAWQSQLSRVAKLEQRLMDQLREIP